jgi:hypothetical protein
MAGEISRENGKKGGRKKGLASIKAEEARSLLAQMVADEIEPLGRILIEKAKGGDVGAMKELFDRAFGKAPQAITGPNGGELKIMFDGIFNNK